jgi:hypothetical protein
MAALLFALAIAFDAELAPGLHHPDERMDMEMGQALAR